VSGSPAVFEDVTGAILVGGKSSRLGCDKVLLRLDGRPVFQHLCGLLEPLVFEVLLVGHNRPEFETLGFRVVQDIVPNAGPLGGIFTALMSATTPYVFVAAGDMPYLTVPLISTIVQDRGDVEAIIPKGPMGYEPLCAVYSRACTEPLRSSLERGNRRIMTALEGLKILTPEIPSKDEEQDPFFNINYPEDLKKLRFNV
jgi:molybdopterin-guanine dinucleotide biosynthesis protein A